MLKALGFSYSSNSELTRPPGPCKTPSLDLSVGRGISEHLDIAALGKELHKAS